MSLLTKNKKSKQRIFEEWVYEQVAQEITQDQRRVGLWTKAKALSGGEEAKVESIYIQLRAESIVDEAKVAQELVEESRKKARQEASSRESTIHKAKKAAVLDQSKEKEPFKLDKFVFKIFGLVAIFALIGVFVSAS
ncbi:hypothetical protein [Vibrio maerlii]|uniref:hypothetical protein n=1 Tax=Vibrio maerlii TaxID=2231648 RepID=UPI000E3D9F73|nr:hypothetical protein [Vibrio maerlii]